MSRPAEMAAPLAVMLWPVLVWLALLGFGKCDAEFDAVFHGELGAVGEQMLVLAVVIA